MSFSIKFHRLFEVKIIHEYFLLYDDILTYYDATVAEQDKRLERRLLQGQYQLMHDLSIEPTADCAKILRNHRLKMVQTPTGLVVGCEGKVKTLPDNSEIIVPAISLLPNIEFTFIIKVKNAHFKNYSALPFRSPLAGNYLFANEPTSVNNAGFASMSQPISTFQTNKSYLPGDLAQHGSLVREAIANTESNSYWEDVEGDGYVNENDRRLYPKAFVHYPTTAELDNPISFLLKDFNNNTEVKRIEFAKAVKSGHRLNFSMVSAKGADIPLPDGWYSLEIDNSNGTVEKAIYLLSEFSQADFGMIAVRTGETNATYRILGDEGAILNPYPRFQIRLRSRRTYWRYQAKQTEKKLEPNGTANFFKDDQNNNAIDLQAYKVLITKKPQKLANLPIQIVDDVGTMEVFPQPDPSPIRTNRTENLAPTEPPGKIYSDVYITTVNGKISIVS